MCHSGTQVKAQHSTGLYFLTGEVSKILKTYDMLGSLILRWIPLMQATSRLSLDFTPSIFWKLLARGTIQEITLPKLFLLMMKFAAFLASLEPVALMSEGFNKTLKLQ